MCKNEKRQPEGLQDQEKGASSPMEQRALVARPLSRVPAPSFLETKAYRYFEQVCEASRKYGYMALCVGDRGVGKTRAARQYTRWDFFEPLLREQRISCSPEVLLLRGAFYAPRSTVTPRGMEEDLALLRWSLQAMAEGTQSVKQETPFMPARLCPMVVDLLIVDEVDRLSSKCLQVLRDVNEQDHLSVVLLGRPGGARRLAQVYDLASQVGKVHKFAAPEKAETRAFLEQQLQRQGASAQADVLDFIHEKTRANFQQMCFLMNHLDHMQPRSGGATVSKDMVKEALRQPLNQNNAQQLL